MPQPHPTYGQIFPNKTQLTINQSYEGETIEQRVEKILNNNEPITDGATQIIYTDRQDGVIPEYNIRNDRWDQAIDLTTEMTNRNLTERQKRIDERIKGKNVDKIPIKTPPADTPAPGEPK